ncbi:putative membrane-associated kinase regulator 5 [Raphanus sativus]|uniref:Membrane-associated kinase regulator 5 n=1 Tax=Raphanus sativus TaxID=3726 RepID=A0A6J0MQH8_RAPSA|nr:membrane-associated kinase regulator 5 [Raphanus sativus]KAJ4866747.1 putative membrane-associated kinase regulator 5 [Raphanus sativus]
MEALTFMKLWLTNTTGNKPRRETRISESTVRSSTSLEDSYVDLCEGDDSFFDLEFSLSDFSLQKNKTPEEREVKQTTTFSVSKSKVIPVVEPTSKPQSPTTPLNTGRKFRAFSFKKKENNRSLNVRFKLEDETSTTSFRKTTTTAKPQLKPDMMFFEDSVSSVSSSKRFFDLIKPLYNKTTKKQSINSVTTSPASSPATAREKQRKNIPSGIRRQLGKSRSASAAVGVMSPAKRLDESLQVQQDGIQSAILHCKKSFHGSESCTLPRSSSESYSQEKLSTSSSEDSYLFSRLSSVSMSEKSIDGLTSIQEQREKISN